MTTYEAWEGFVGSQTPAEFMEISRQKMGAATTVEQAVAAYVPEIPFMFQLSPVEVANLPANLADLLAEYIHQSTAETALTREDKLQLGRITTRNEAGRHFTEVYDGAWLERMEAAGHITIHRPVHEATGIQYSQEFYTVEVSPEVAEWFDSYGELIED